MLVTKITNVAPATDGTDAVNYDQLKAARTVVTSNDKSVTINKTTNGDQVTYDLHVKCSCWYSIYLELEIWCSFCYRRYTFW